MQCLKRANCKLTFEFGAIDDRCMTVFVESCGTKQRLAKGQTSCEVPVEFPGELCITVLGKQPTDTKLNDTGDVVQDMYVKIVGLSINGMSVGRGWLERSISLVRLSDNKVVVSNYLGFNGQVKIPLNKANSFIWLGSTN